MALHDVLRILDRAIADEGYRERLLSEPAKALRGEPLARGEKAMLAGLAHSPYTASPRGLADTRKMVLGALAFGGETEPEPVEPRGA